MSRTDLIAQLGERLDRRNQRAQGLTAASLPFLFSGTASEFSFSAFWTFL
jgi:hypothetical protein